MQIKEKHVRVTGLCAGNSPVTWKMFPFDDVIIECDRFSYDYIAKLIIRLAERYQISWVVMPEKRVYE